MSEDLMIFSGNASKKLASEVAKELGATLGNATVDRFKDGEIHVVLNENVRGKDVFVIQSTCPPSDNLMELILLIDALKRSSAERVTAVLPYLAMLGKIEDQNQRECLYLLKLSQIFFKLLA